MKTYELGSKEKIHKNIKKEPFRIVQFTDTQLGSFYNLAQLTEAINKINELQPDIVVFTGDLIDVANKYEEINKVGEVLSKITSKYGKYAVWGNHDYGGGGSKYYKDILTNGGFELLVNENKNIEKNNQIYSVIGSDCGTYGEINEDLVISKLDKSNYNILLIHEPDLMDRYSKGPIDLALAGHTHGGQVALPIIGAIVKVPLGRNYTKGFYDFKNERKSKLFVSSGLGNTKLPFRFLNIPEIVLFEIYK